ncbi:MAG TPA: proton-conducting transporter membrane subunit [Polyangiales bacterium]
MSWLGRLALVALLFAPFLGAELAARAKSPETGRASVVRSSALTFALACGLSGRFFMQREASRFDVDLPLWSQEHALHFTIDALNAPLLLLLTLLTLAISLGAPFTLLAPHKLRALLQLTALNALLLVTVDLPVLGLGYCLVLLPIRQLATRGSESAHRAAVARVFKLYHLLGLGCFVTALVLFGYSVGPSHLLDLNILHLDTSAVPASLRPVLFTLFVVAVLVRTGVAPFHSWLPEALQHGSLLGVTFLMSMRTGMYLLARLVIPAFPAETMAAMPLLTSVALLSAVYGAIAAISQVDLRRMVGFLIVSQSGIMLTGFVFADEHAISGSLLYWLGFAVATLGLVIMIAALRTRTGTSDVRLLGGLVTRVPQLAAAFFLFGLATIAIPGTLAFAAEDMLIHGALEAHPLLTIVMAAAMVLNAITVVRSFASTFLGQPSPHGAAQGLLDDLLPRERVVSVALLVALISSGLYPQALIRAQGAAAHHIAEIVGPAAQADASLHQRQGARHIGAQNTCSVSSASLQAPFLGSPPVRMICAASGSR